MHTAAQRDSAPRKVRLDVEDGRAVNKVDATQMQHPWYAPPSPQHATLCAHVCKGSAGTLGIDVIEAHEGETDGAGAVGRARRKHAHGLANAGGHHLGPHAALPALDRALHVGVGVKRKHQPHMAEPCRTHTHTYTHDTPHVIVKPLSNSTPRMVVGGWESAQVCAVCAVCAFKAGKGVGAAEAEGRVQREGGARFVDQQALSRGAVACGEDGVQTADHYGRPLRRRRRRCCRRGWHMARAAFGQERPQ
jgi:hypothetical protein